MALKQKIIKCFNSKAYSYHHAADIQPHIAERLACRLPGNKPVEHILEIGCGTGFLSDYLIRSFPNANLLLTDIAPAMVKITQERFSETPNVVVQVMDGEALKTPEQYDLIVSSMAMHWFSDFKKSLQHIMDKLAPGGSFFFSVLGKNSLHEWRHVFTEMKVSAPTPAFPDQQEWQAHFPGIQVEVELTQQPYSNSHTFLKTLKQIGAHASHAKHAALHSSLLRKAMRHFDSISPQGIRVSYEVVYGSFTKP